MSEETNNMYAIAQSDGEDMISLMIMKSEKPLVSALYRILPLEAEKLDPTKPL